MALLVAIAMAMIALPDDGVSRLIFKFQTGGQETLLMDSIPQISFSFLYFLPVAPVAQRYLVTL